MGKKPVFGMVSFCWLGLALAGCDTFNSNSVVPRDRNQGQARSTFGNNKDAAISKNPSLPDNMIQNKSSDPGFVQERPAGFDARDPRALPPGPPQFMDRAGVVNNPPKVTDRVDSSRSGGQRTPGAAGLVDVPPGGGNNTPTISDVKKTWPMSGADDGVTESAAPSASGGPLSPSRNVPSLPPGSTGVALPPAPTPTGPSLLPASSNGAKMPPLSLPGAGEPRPLPPSPPPAPAGAKSLDAPPPPSLPAALQPAEQPGPIYDAPPPSGPPAPAAPAPKPAEKPASASDGPPPPPPPVPFQPTSPKQ